MKYAFADQTRKILAIAVEEAHRLRHDYVGPEHMLLGLVRTIECKALIERCGADAQEVSAALLESLRPGVSARRGQLPYTSRAKKVLELAMRSSREAGQSTVTTEDLLLSIVAERRNVAVQVLERFGVTAAAVAGGLDEDALSMAPDASTSSMEEADVSIRIDDASDRSIYEQIVAQIQEAVAMAALRPGQRLPPVRRLADQLDIAPGTVARAYSELERLGVVITEGARGTRVAERPKQPLPEAERPETLVGLLRPVVVAAFHLGATGGELRAALERAMNGIFTEGGESTST
jgi:DNA-binding transcriptional regulator YhcF (GntR family)